MIIHILQVRELNSRGVNWFPKTEEPLISEWAFEHSYFMPPLLYKLIQCFKTESKYIKIS